MHSAFSQMRPLLAAAPWRNRCSPPNHRYPLRAALLVIAAWRISRFQMLSPITKCTSSTTMKAHERFLNRAGLQTRASKRSREFTEPPAPMAGGFLIFYFVACKGFAPRARVASDLLFRNVLEEPYELRAGNAP